MQESSSVRSIGSVTSNHLRSSFVARQHNLLEFVQDELQLSELQAKMLVYGNRCDSRNEVYNMLVRDGPNHTYLHLYCPGVVNLCLICDQTQENHNFVSPSVFKQTMERIHSQQERSELGEQPEDGPTANCSVCMMDVREEDIARLNGTPHGICMDCFNSFLTEEINSGRVVKLQCPHCTIPLKAEWIQDLVDQRTFKKYKLFLGNKQIFSNPQLRWCPNPKCSKIIDLKGNSGRTATCVCGTVVCTKCNREEHPRLTCDELFRNEVKEWADVTLPVMQATDVQKCKKCKSVVEKVSGCNHMTCGYCRYEWCWLCGATYSPIHFSPFNPFGCPGLQHGEHTSKNWGCLRLCMYRLGWFLLILLLIPLALPIGLVVAGPTLLIASVKNSSWYYYQRDCNKCGIWLGLIIVGLIINPFVWVGLLIYSIPQGIMYLVRYYRQRREIEEVSAQHLRDRLIEEKLNE